MGLDIRLPIGLMFSLIGLLLTAAGLTTSDPKTLERSLNININLYWGVFLIAFGAIMLVLAWRAKKCEAEQPPKS
jgi:hypothetical protein